MNRALAERVAHERRLEAMAQAVQAYEDEFGEISTAEMAAQERADRRSARVVRERTPASKGRASPRGRK